LKKNILTMNKLFNAVEYDKVDNIKHILEHSTFDVNSCVYEGGTILHFACNAGSIKVIKLLMTHDKVDVNKPDVCGGTALNSTHISIDVAKLLLKFRDINVNKKDKNGDTPLHTACVSRNKQMVKLLLTHPNININEVNNKGMTPLAYSCYYNNDDIIRVLLNNPAIDINKSNIIAPLHLAVEKKNINVIKLLLCQPGININQVDEYGRTPLDYICALSEGNTWLSSRRTIKINVCSKEEIIIKLLMAYGATITNQKIKICNNSELDKYLTDPNVINDWKATFDFISHLFTLVVLLCDEYFTFNTQSCGRSVDMIRFFTICKQLPMELQMLICHRLYGSHKNYVKSDSVTLHCKLILKE